MNPTELFATYPNAVMSISYVELILCEPDEDHPVSAWDTFIAGSAKISPADVVKLVKDGCQEELELGSRGRWTEAIAQCDHPEFLTYLKGKMGAM